MNGKDKFTNSIIDSTLDILKTEYGWSENLISKILELHRLDQLTDVQSLSCAIEEVAVSKEEEND